jgi:hypothetical protein
MFQTAGGSSDDTSASFSVSSSDKARDPGTVVGMGIRANDGIGRGQCQNRESTTYALPARQARADSAPEHGTYGPVLRGRGGAQTARPLAQLTERRRIGDDVVPDVSEATTNLIMLREGRAAQPGQAKLPSDFRPRGHQ